MSEFQYPTTCGLCGQLGAYDAMVYDPFSLTRVHPECIAARDKPKDVNYPPVESAAESVDREGW